MNQAIYTGCNADQIRWGGCDDPREILVVGNTYNIKSTDVHTWHTKLELKEFPGKFFNSICFHSGSNNMSEPTLDTDEFIAWFKKNQPLRGKTKTMEKICKAFPKSAYDVRQPFPPYGYHKYSTLAAIVMNTLKDEGKMKTYKKGNAYCYEIIGDNGK